MQQFEDVLNQLDAQAEAFGLSAGAVEHLLPARTLQDGQVVGALQVADSAAAAMRRAIVVPRLLQAVDFRPQFNRRCRQARGSLVRWRTTSLARMAPGSRAAAAQRR